MTRTQRHTRERHEGRLCQRERTGPTRLLRTPGRVRRCLRPAYNRAATSSGGQGKKGTWGAKPAEPDPKNPAAYVADTGKEIISKRERYYWPETGLIEGEPNQFNKLKKVHGWIKVDKLVAEPSP